MSVCVFACKYVHEWVSVYMYVCVCERPSNLCLLRKCVCVCGIPFVCLSPPESGQVCVMVG